MLWQCMADFCILPQGPSAEKVKTVGGPFGHTWTVHPSVMSMAADALVASPHRIFKYGRSVPVTQWHSMLHRTALLLNNGALGRRMDGSS